MYGCLICGVKGNHRVSAFSLDGLRGLLVCSLLFAMKTASTCISFTEDQTEEGLIKVWAKKIGYEHYLSFLLLCYLLVLLFIEQWESLHKLVELPIAFHMLAQLVCLEWLLFLKKISRVLLSYEWVQEKEKRACRCVYPNYKGKITGLEAEGRDSGLNSVPDCVGMKRHFSNIIDPHYLLRPYLQICLLASQ